MSDPKIKVLYVDDEVNNLVAFTATFRKQYEIFTASSAQDGLNILEKEEIHVILTDQRMPGLKGVDFLKLVIEKYPDPARMLLTGYSDIEALIEAVNTTHIYKCLAKPWNKAEVNESIQAGYEVYRKNKERRELMQLKRTNEQLEFILREKLAS